MKIEEVISNQKIYGLYESISASKYPFAVDAGAVNSETTNTVKKLAQAPIGSGHDNFLKGIVVQFDLTFTKQAWSELQRYHFIDFVSSQSAMHRITKFDLDQQYIRYADPSVVDLMKDMVDEYKEDPTEDNWLRIIYSSPAGLKLTARMTTNYQQLKTIYSQRRNHRLPEWQAFCDWVETLPYSHWITNKGSD